MIPIHLDKATGECNTINLTILIDSLQNDVMMSRLLSWKIWYISLSTERRTYYLLLEACRQTVHLSYLLEA